jgi:hypothetical protein
LRGFDRREGAGSDIVAKIIEFYMPSSFRRKVEYVSLARRRKVIEFGSRIRPKVMRRQERAPILRSVWIGGLGLQLTYQDPFVQQRADEFHWD